MNSQKDVLCFRVRGFGLRVVAWLALFSFPLLGAASDDGKIIVTLSTSGWFSTKHILSVANTDIVPRTVRVSVFNAPPTKDLVYEKVFSIEANRSEVQEIEPFLGKSFSAPLSWKYEWIRGRLTKADPVNDFSIPFGTEVASVCQSHDGPLTTHRDIPYALDFCAPEKTQILAAKDGVVIDVVDSFVEGGLRPELLDKWNVIRLLHDDGLQTVYGHIYPKSANVVIGSQVKRGQLIALVGSVGYSSSPHLHFEVRSLAADLTSVVVNPQFLDKDGSTVKIRYGAFVSSNGIVEAKNESMSGAQATGDKAVAAGPPTSDRTTYPEAESARSANCSKVKGDALAKANECMISRNYKEAQRLLSDMLRVNPSLARGHAMLGLCLAWQGNHEEAIGSFKKALALGWSTYDTFAWYARSLDAIGQFEEAIKYNRRALIVAPWLVDVTGRLSEQLVAKGRPQEAVQLLEKFDAKRRKDGKTEVFSERILMIKEGM